MREREMRQRVEQFLGVRLRNMLMPATLGLGLALAGCGGDQLQSDDAASGQTKEDVAHAGGGQSPPDVALSGTDTGRQDAGTAVPAYMAQMPLDAVQDLGTPDKPSQPDANSSDANAGKEDAGGGVMMYMAQMPRDAAQDYGTPGGMLYMAPVPAYMAQMPVDGGTALRSPDAGRVVALYMTQTPPSES